MNYELTDRFLVGSGLEQTWAFFSRAENLPLITPPWLHFTIKTPSPVHIENDSLLDYTIRWAGIPIRWRTRIIDWQPPHRFIDLQLRGPYRLWHHQHQFVQRERGVECSDRVIYALPFAPLDRLVHAAVVRRQLLEIFRYRRRIIADHLGELRPLQNDVQIARVN